MNSPESAEKCMSLSLFTKQTSSVTFMSGRVHLKPLLNTKQTAAKQAAGDMLYSL